VNANVSDEMPERLTVLVRISRLSTYTTTSNEPASVPSFSTVTTPVTASEDLIVVGEIEKDAITGTNACGN